ncbi:MAG: hypothetical protein KJS97_02235 [Alphaproteobacteria bacterium]|nr:hypothetical protein [Alphaproteobacteria bacterium]
MTTNGEGSAPDDAARKKKTAMVVLWTSVFVTIAMSLTTVLILTSR